MKNYDCNGNIIEIGMNCLNKDTGKTFLVDASMISVMSGFLNTTRDKTHNHIEIIS